MINLNFTDKTKKFDKHIQDKSSTPICATNNYIFSRKDFESFLVDNGSKTLKLKLREKIGPFCLWTKKSKSFYMAAEKRIMDELSYKNIMKKLLQFEKLKTVVMNETQSEVFEVLPRLYPDIKKKGFNELNLEEINFEDPIIKKLTYQLINNS